MIWLLILMWLLTLVSLVMIFREVRRSMEASRADHAKCIAHVASVTSNRFVAARLRELADGWDTAEEMGEHRRIANTLYRVGGPSVPAIWLREKADRIEGAS